MGWVSEVSELSPSDRIFKYKNNKPSKISQPSEKNVLDLIL
jgi:hypothetical protein